MPAGTTKPGSSGLSLAAVLQLREEVTISRAECWAADRQRERQAAQLTRISTRCQTLETENIRLRALLGMARSIA